MREIIRQKVLTLHESGYRDVDSYVFDTLDVIQCGEHFVKYPRCVDRNIVSTAITEIGDFELPVLKFKNLGRRWYEWKDRWTWETVGRCYGSWVKLVDGRKIYLKETLDDIKQMIEG